jgi:hypothetical protein
MASPRLRESNAASPKHTLEHCCHLACACMSLENTHDVIIRVAGQRSCIAVASRYPKAYRSITSLCFAVDASDLRISRYCKRLNCSQPLLGTGSSNKHNQDTTAGSTVFD